MRVNLKAAIALADFRIKLSNRVPCIKCPICDTSQVQLVDWISKILWKCRMCKYMWEELKSGLLAK